MVGDARILQSVVELAVNNQFKELSTVLETLGTLNSGRRLKYSNIINISYVLLIFASPLQLSIDDLLILIKGMEDNITDEASDNGDEVEEVEEFANWVSSKCEESVDSIDSIMTAISQFSDKYPMEDDLLFSVLKTRLIINSMYLDDIELKNISIVNSPAFHQWFKGFYQPFKYYWDNYGKLTSSIKYHEILGQDYFQHLISPVGSLDSDNLSLYNWLNKVIIPISKFSHDFSSLEQWCFNEANLQSKSYEVWFTTIKSLVDKEVPLEDFQGIVEKFVAFCYFDKEVENSLEMIRKFDYIKDTLVLLVPIAPKSSTIKTGEVKYVNEKFDSFQQFMENTSLIPLISISKDSLINLSEMIESCLKLYPINQLTIPKFLELKYGSSQSEDFKREASIILVGINTSNSTTLISSLELFKDIFVEDDTEINELMVERFLFNNLFDLVDDQVPDAVLRKLLTKKFWDSINYSTSLDDIRLSYAEKCLDMMSSKEQTSEEKEEISRFRNLLKMFNLIKNFKISLNRQPISPSDILKKFSKIPHNDLQLELEPSSPMGLITTILEQNPKSYRAFEKLFKILNHFLIFLNVEINSNYYFKRLISACIESSLIDFNFNFAYSKSIELFSNYTDLNDLWLVFYQIGNYQTPDWFDNPSSNLPILIKKSFVLSNYLSVINRSLTTVDNSRIIVELWNKINNEIEEITNNDTSLQDQDQSDASTVNSTVNSIAHGISRNLSPMSEKPGEKLSNLFVSGLGWAIGANK
ncbi:hypothetical protein CLIB1444_05S03246 [[Candida] jaroonii]|uniref:Uncharacterized protein n=1 Tax=[Candida] jaroonii TaxID=467808 RepID=A0ACA9Y7U1_9ASCO|nr:hypothetical protein CLIB1444_05S03246 [[Candida] jaroonii]